jgi:hypothetical protein
MEQELTAEMRDKKMAPKYQRMLEGLGVLWRPAGRIGRMTGAFRFEERIRS